MEKTVFRERLPGLKIEQVIRNEEFNMAARHMHSEYEIYYLVEGEIQYYLEGESFFLKPGMLCFVGREKIHKTSSVPGSPYSNRILMEIKPEWLTDFFKAMKSITEDAFFDKFRVLQLNKEEQKRIEDILLVIADEARDRRAGCELIVKSKLTELMIYVLRSRRDENEIYESPQAERALGYPRNNINEVAEYIQRNCHEKISLDDLSERFFISKCYLSRRFKEATNFTVNEYLTVQRLKKARKLLETTGYSMTQVSEETGFESVSYFEKVFKKHMGLTPLKYRKLRQTPMPEE